MAKGKILVVVVVVFYYFYFNTCPIYIYITCVTSTAPFSRAPVMIEVDSISRILFTLAARLLCVNNKEEFLLAFMM